MRRLLLVGTLLLALLGSRADDCYETGGRLCGSIPTPTPTPWAEVCCAPIAPPPAAPSPTQNLCYQTAGRLGC